MRFVLKAIFFLAVVAAFIPREGANATAAPDAQAAPAPDALAAPRVDLSHPEQNLCAHRPALCDAATESATAARVISQIAIHSAQSALAESGASEAAMNGALAPATQPASP